MPSDNPAEVADLADLADPDVKVALCAEQVPCGKFAKQIVDGAGLSVTPVTFEENVKGVVTKVTHRRGRRRDRLRHRRDGGG